MCAKQWRCVASFVAAAAAAGDRRRSRCCRCQASGQRVAGQMMHCTRCTGTAQTRTGPCRSGRRCVRSSLESLVMLAEIHARRAGGATAGTVLGRRGRCAAQIVPEVMTGQRRRGRHCRRRDAAAAAAQLERFHFQLRRCQLVGMPQTDLRMRRCGRGRCRCVVQMMMMQMRLRLGLDVQLLLQQESCSRRRRWRRLLRGQCGTANGGGTAGRRTLR